MTSSTHAAGKPHAGPGRRVVKAASLTSQVATLIEEQCIASGLQPGDALPAEGELAAEFGVSRIVVREAMKAVEARGLIRRQQGKLAVIAELNARPVEDYVARSARMDKSYAKQLTEVRKALEVHSARLAAGRARVNPDGCREQVDTARALISEMYTCPADAKDRATLDVAFHHALADMTGNVILAQMLGALDRPLQASREQHHQASLDANAPSNRWADEHQQVLDAITSGDVAAAINVMEEHLNLSLREVESRPDTDTDRR